MPDLLLFSILLAAIVIHRLHKTIYRLHYHPLSGIPGSLLARATYLPLVYHDVCRGGRYCHVIREWHARYGPVIRISPEEVHISDPNSYDTIYPGSLAGYKVDKYGKDARLFGTQFSAFGSASHDQHRMRRGMIQPLFTRRAVRELQTLITSKVDLFIANLRAHAGSASPVNLLSAFGALTGDVISAYSFGQSLNLLADPDFAPDWHDCLTDVAALGHIGRHINFWPLLDMLPEWLVHRLDPKMQRITRLRTLICTSIERVMQQHSVEVSAPSTSSKPTRNAKKSDAASDDDENNEELEAIPRTLFASILSASAPSAEKTASRLAMEANVVMAAGTTTTADSLAVITYHLLAQPRLLGAARAELRTAQAAKGARLAWDDLEALPLLTALIKEGLRIHPGTVARLPRVHPVPLRICGIEIPPGTPVAMSALDVQFDPTIFPDPHDFKPDRWIARDAEAEKLERYLVAFGKGTRQCVGMTLAWAEMYLALAGLLGDERLELELFETSDGDVRVACDKFVAGFETGSRGIRVLVSAD